MTEPMEDIEPLVTECPQCRTRFRVTEAQLQVAGGRVRCGGCLTVFYGTDHLLWDLEKSTEAENPEDVLDDLLEEIDAFAARERQGAPAEAAAGDAVDAASPAPEDSTQSRMTSFAPESFAPDLPATADAADGADALDFDDDAWRPPAETPDETPGEAAENVLTLAEDVTAAPVSTDAPGHVVSDFFADADTRALAAAGPEPEPAPTQELDPALEPASEPEPEPEPLPACDPTHQTNMPEIAVDELDPVSDLPGSPQVAVDDLPPYPPSPQVSPLVQVARTADEAGQERPLWGDPRPPATDGFSIGSEADSLEAWMSPPVVAGAGPDDPFVRLWEEPEHDAEPVPDPVPTPDQEPPASAAAPALAAESETLVPGVMQNPMPSLAEMDAFEGAMAPPRRRRWLRSILITGLFLLIVFQVVWYFFPAWEQDPQRRWLSEEICQVAGCQLTPLRDLSQLLLTNVIVRVNPEDSTQRIADMLMVNTAEFEQAYPDVEIAFRTPEGDLVAWKRFAPQDYLVGAARSARAIPPKTPVRISLQVSDPGSLSYSYEFTLK
ncbi:MAG: DUF3426 domain-containing protein [Pseudomonadales bacterium]